MDVAVQEFFVILKSGARLYQADCLWEDQAGFRDQPNLQKFAEPRFSCHFQQKNYAADPDLVESKIEFAHLFHLENLYRISNHCVQQSKQRRQELEYRI